MVYLYTKTTVLFIWNIIINGYCKQLGQNVCHSVWQCQLSHYIPTLNKAVILFFLKKRSCDLLTWQHSITSCWFIWSCLNRVWLCLRINIHQHGYMIANMLQILVRYALNELVTYKQLIIWTISTETKI